MWERNCAVEGKHLEVASYVMHECTRLCILVRTSGGSRSLVHSAQTRGGLRVPKTAPMRTAILSYERACCPQRRVRQHLVRAECAQLCRRSEACMRDGARGRGSYRLYAVREAERSTSLCAGPARKSLKLN